jgi:hypothetical protein
LLLVALILLLLNFYKTEYNFIMSSDSVSESNSAKTPPMKKTKFLSVYLRKLEEQYSWLKFVPFSVYRAYCTLCKREFSIVPGVNTDCRQHSCKEARKGAKNGYEDVLHCM